MEGMGGLIQEKDIDVADINNGKLDYVLSEKL